MHDSDRRSWRLPVPLGLVGAVALVFMVESLVFHDSDCFRGSTGQCWRESARLERRVSKSQPDAILCLGDSLVKFGVMPQVLERRTGRKAYNLATYSGPPVVSYFLLRRALEHGSRPPAIAVDFVAGLLQEGPNSTKRAYPWADLLDAREAFDLARTASDASLFARIMLAKVLHSYKDRYEVRAWLQNRQTSEGAYVYTLFLRRNWRENNGAQVQPPPKKAPDFGMVPTGGPRMVGTWQSDPVNESYLRRFLELAGRHKVPVVWVVPPLHPHNQGYLDVGGDDVRFDAFARDVAAHYPGVLIADARRSDYVAGAFVDEAHLAVAGALALSQDVADVLGRVMAGRPAGPRWIALPSYRPCSPGVRYEDFARSAATVRRQLRIRSRL